MHAPERVGRPPDSARISKDSTPPAGRLPNPAHPAQKRSVSNGGIGAAWSGACESRREHIREQKSGSGSGANRELDRRKPTTLKRY
jgi:hypothetical protein